MKVIPVEELKVFCIDLQFQGVEEFLNKTVWDGALCSELAENVQKVTLVGSFNFGSSWHPFGGFTQ